MLTLMFKLHFLKLSFTPFPLIYLAPQELLGCRDLTYACLVDTLGKSKARESKIFTARSSRVYYPQIQFSDWSLICSIYEMHCKYLFLKEIVKASNLLFCYVIILSIAWFFLPFCLINIYLISKIKALLTSKDCLFVMVAVACFAVLSYFACSGSSKECQSEWDGDWGCSAGLRGSRTSLMIDSCLLAWFLSVTSGPCCWHH